MAVRFPITLKKHVRLSGTLTCRSGLRVGASKDEADIGGTDNPVIRDPVSKYPYIPGSSLKGKLRSLSEYRLGKVQQDGQPCTCRQCLVCTIFGPHRAPNHDLGPSRILVRDAQVSAESKPILDKLLEQGLPHVEIKSENMINRRTGVAEHPRTQERVPAGTKFDLEIVLRIFEGDDEKELVDFVGQALDSLGKEYLGGSGSRGYGWVEVDYKVLDA